MLILAVTFKIKPERRAEAVEAVLRMTAETHKEEGCLAYRFYSPVDDPNTFFVYEEWASEEAFQGHIHSAHMKVYAQEMAPVTDGGAEVKRYDLP